MDDWKSFLRSIAPALGSSIAGPLGGVAASFIANKLGIEEKTVESITKTLSENKLSPDQVTQIKTAELEFQKFLKTNEIDLEKVHAADRNSARDLLKATGSYVPAALTFVITAGFFGVLGAMFVHPEVKESTPLMIMLGSLGTAWTGACAFWFGTTKNSQEKTNLLANSAPAK